MMDVDVLVNSGGLHKVTILLTMILFTIKFKAQKHLQHTLRIDTLLKINRISNKNFKL